MSKEVKIGLGIIALAGVVQVAIFANIYSSYKDLNQAVKDIDETIERVNQILIDEKFQDIVDEWGD